MWSHSVLIDDEAMIGDESERIDEEALQNNY
jgi:hypothetical protein